MKRFTPYLLLVPAVLSALMLPMTLRGESPYQTTPTSHILSIFLWLLLFCITLGIARSFRFTRVLVLLAFLTFLSRHLYRYHLDETGDVYFLQDSSGVAFSQS